MRKKIGRDALVLGCDPSSQKLAFYITTSASTTGQPFQARLRKSGPYTPESAAEAKNVCRHVLTLCKPMLADHQRRYLFLEEPVVGVGGIRSSLVQAYINGVVQAEFVSYGFVVRVTHQATWKSAHGLKGNAGKPEVETMMASSFPEDWASVDGDGDLLDAAALARFGCQAI